MFVLETPNLLLRDMRAADETAFVTISQDQKYQRFYSEQDCLPEKYQQLTRLFISQASESPRTAYQLAIEHKGSGAMIGTVCLRLEDHQQASMGGGLSRAFQCRNLMQEAATALLDFAFTQLTVHRVYAETISANLGAVRLCQQLGMRQEALLLQNRFFKGQWWDTTILAMLKTEWQSRH